MNITSTKHAARRGLNILIYGSAGAGKTTLLGTTGDTAGTVILSAEAGLLPLRHLDIRVIEIDSLATLKQALGWLQGPQAGARWVCVDSLSEIAERVLTFELQRQRDPRKAYGEMATEIINAVKAMRDLQMNVVLLAKRGVTEDGGVHRGSILMPGKKLQESLPYELDIVAELRVVREESGKIVRWLQTAADGYGEAKDRSGALAPAEPPDLAALARKVIEAVPPQARPAAPPAAAAQTAPAASPQAAPPPPAPQPAASVRERVTNACNWLAGAGAGHLADETWASIAPGKDLAQMDDATAFALLKALAAAAKRVRAERAA